MPSRRLWERWGGVLGKVEVTAPVEESASPTRKHLAGEKLVLIMQGPFQRFFEGADLGASFGHMGCSRLVYRGQLPLSTEVLTAGSYTRKQGLELFLLLCWVLLLPCSSQKAPNTDFQDHLPRLSRAWNHQGKCPCIQNKFRLHKLWESSTGISGASKQGFGVGSE